MTVVKCKTQRSPHVIKLLLKASGKSYVYQFPALATLIYVDSDLSLPTGQWSAVSPTVYLRGSQ